MASYSHNNNGNYYGGDNNNGIPPAPQQAYSPYAYTDQTMSSSPSSSPTLRRRPHASHAVSSSQTATTVPHAPMSGGMVKKLDFMFPKVSEEFTVKTERGGQASIVAYGLVVLLVLAELYSHVAQNMSTVEHIKVDTSLGKRMRVNLNITFPALACDDLHVDAMDVAGDSQIDVEDTFVKQQLHRDGTPRSDKEIKVEMNAHQQELAKREEILKKELPENYCGSCYGAEANEGDCCNTCDEILDAYKKKRWNPQSLTRTTEQCVREGRDKKEPKRMTRGQGCNLSGYMTVNRVAGNFHIAMGEGIERDGRHIHVFVPDDTPNFNASHVIHELSFGPSYEGGEPPLNGVTKIVTEEHGTTGLFQYFIKVVPTTYKTPTKKMLAAAEQLPSIYEESEDSKRNGDLETNRFFFTERFRPLMTDYLEDHHFDEQDEGKAGVHAGGANRGHAHNHHEHHQIQNSVLPGVFFIYEIYPFAVEISQNHVPLTHLLIRLMATVGGVFTIVRWADAYMYARDRKHGRVKG